MRPISAVEIARQFLEDSIISGHFKPGDKIKEEMISKKLEISRPPIREALKTLETEGLVTRKPRRGVFISQINEHDIWEIYSLKAVLYKMAISIAFDKCSEQDIHKIEKTVQKMEACIESKEKNKRLKYQKYHDQFHDIILTISGHGRLMAINRMLHNQVKRISYESFSDEIYLRRSCNYHRKILEAVKKGDKSLAEKLMKKHILTALERHMDLSEVPDV